jgi:hypothetical protein
VGIKNFSSKEKNNLQFATLFFPLSTSIPPFFDVMFTLRFGKNESRLFNANCSVTVLLDALRTSTGNVEFEAVDLVDSDMVMVDLRQQTKVGERASNFLKEGGKYTLVAVVLRGGEENGEPESLDEEFVVLFEDDEGNVPEIQKSPPSAGGKKGAPPAGKKK